MPIKDAEQYEYAKRRLASGELTPEQTRMAQADIGEWEAGEKQIADASHPEGKLEPTRAERIAGFGESLFRQADAGARAFTDASFFGVPTAVAEKLQPGNRAEGEKLAQEFPTTSAIAAGAGYLNPVGAGAQMASRLYKAAAPVAKAGEKLGRAIPGAETFLKLGRGGLAGGAAGFAEGELRNELPALVEGVPSSERTTEENLFEIGLGAFGGSVGEGLGLTAKAFRDRRMAKPENKPLRDLERAGGEQTALGSGVKLPKDLEALEKASVSRPVTQGLPEARPEELAARELAPKIVGQFKSRSDSLQRELKETKTRFRAMDPQARVSAAPFVQELDTRMRANVSTDTRPPLGSGTPDSPQGGVLLVGQSNREMTDMMQRLVRSEQNPAGLDIRPFQGNEQAVIQGTMVKLPQSLARHLGKGDVVVPATMSMDEVDNLVSTMSELAKTNKPVPGQASLDYKALDAAARKVRDQFAGGEYSKAMSAWSDKQQAFEQDLGNALGVRTRGAGEQVSAFDEMTPDEQKAVMNALRGFGGENSLQNDALFSEASRGGLSPDLERLLGLPAAREVRGRAALSNAARTNLTGSGPSFYASGGGFGSMLGVRSDPLFRAAASGASPLLGRVATGGAELLLPEPGQGRSDDRRAIEEELRRKGVTP